MPPRRHDDPITLDDERRPVRAPPLTYSEAYALELRRQRMRAVAPWLLIPAALVTGVVALCALLTWLNGCGVAP